MASPLEAHEIESEYARLVRRRDKFRRLEIIVWFLTALVCLSRVVFEIVMGEGLEFIFRQRFVDFLLAFFVSLFPVLFYLVFGKLPFESLRRKRDEILSLEITPLPSKTEPIPAKVEVAQDDHTFSVNRDDFVKSLTSERILLDLAESSKKLADGIYGRAGVYLMVGVMVAFSGLGFFYAETSVTKGSEFLLTHDASQQTSSGSEIKEELTSSMLSLAPKFGILFFIEFVAFFFLKQYRVAMDEYRYYEAIKRRREEMLVLVKLGGEQNKPIDSFELVKLGQFFSIAGRLDKEETTELLETRRLEKNETAVLEKAIDAIAQAKK